MDQLVKFLEDARAYMSYVGSQYPNLRRDDLINTGTRFVTELSQALSMMSEAPPADMERLANYAAGTLRDMSQKNQTQQYTNPNVTPQTQQYTNPNANQFANIEQQVGQALRDRIGAQQPAALGNIFGNK